MGALLHWCRGRVENPPPTKPEASAAGGTAAMANHRAGAPDLACKRQVPTLEGPGSSPQKERSDARGCARCGCTFGSPAYSNLAIEHRPSRNENSTWGGRVVEGGSHIQSQRQPHGWQHRAPTTTAGYRASLTSSSPGARSTSGSSRSEPLHRLRTSCRRPSCLLSTLFDQDTVARITPSCGISKRSSFPFGVQ